MSIGLNLCACGRIVRQKFEDHNLQRCGRCAGCLRTTNLLKVQHVQEAAPMPARARRPCRNFPRPQFSCQEYFNGVRDDTRKATAPPNIGSTVLIVIYHQAWEKDMSQGAEPINILEKTYINGAKRSVMPHDANRGTTSGHVRNLPVVCVPKAHKYTGNHKSKYLPTQLSKSYQHRKSIELYSGDLFLMLPNLFFRPPLSLLKLPLRPN